MNNHDDKLLDQQYFISKLCQVVYTKQLAERLIKNGDDKFCITSSLHPGKYYLQYAVVNLSLGWVVTIIFFLCLEGLVRTEIWRDSSDTVVSMMIKVMFGVLGKNCWQGAQTQIWAALSDEAKGLNGLYFSDCRRSGYYYKEFVDDPEKR